MRTPTIVLAAAFASLVQCTSITVGPPPPPPVDWHAFDVHRAPDAGAPWTTVVNRVPVAETYSGAVAQPDFAPLAAMLDRDVHFAFPGTSSARGREGVVRAHETLFGAFDSRVITLRRVWRTESAQALEWTMSGVDARDWMGAAPTHRSVAFSGLTLLWTKDNGSITDVHVYFDLATVKAQMVAGSPPGHSARGTRAPDLPGFAPPTPSHGPPQVLEQTGSPEEKNAVSLAGAAIDALESNDQAAYEAAMADDVEVFTLARTQAMHGKDDLRSYFKTMHKAIAQLDTTLDNAWGIAQYAIVEYNIAGEQIGPLGWIPANRDKVVRLHMVDVIELRGGKIARIWRYDNPGEIAIN